MKKIICDKCKQSDFSISTTKGGKAIYSTKSNIGMISHGEIDLCDHCRWELGEIIKNWLGIKD